MKHAIKHDLERETARKALRKAFESYKERFAKYDPTADWVNDDKANIGFSAKGMKLDGTVELTDDAVLMELDVPFILKPFKGKALGIIEEEIQKWVQKAKEGELDDA
jgi:hypothetical protein